MTFIASSNALALLFTTLTDWPIRGVRSLRQGGRGSSVTRSVIALFSSWLQCCLLWLGSGLSFRQSGSLSRETKSIRRTGACTYGRPASPSADESRHVPAAESLLLTK
jgi:hypothetical protein